MRWIPAFAGMTEKNKFLGKLIADIHRMEEYDIKVNILSCE